MGGKSKTQICNLAIIDVGGNPVNNIETDISKEATILNEVWDVILDEVLAAHKWDFAKKWVTGALVNNPTNLDEVFDYVYQLPVADFIRMSRMEDKDSEYEIRGSQLYCNVEDAIYEYVWREEDTFNYPPQFVTALSARLRPILSIALATRGSKAVDWMTLYLQVVLPAAKLADAQDTNQSDKNKGMNTDETDTWLGART